MEYTSTAQSDLEVPASRITGVLFPLISARIIWDSFSTLGPQPGLRLVFSNNAMPVLLADVPCGYSCLCLGLTLTSPLDQRLKFKASWSHFLTLARTQETNCLVTLLNPHSQVRLRPLTQSCSINSSASSLRGVTWRCIGSKLGLLGLESPLC